MKRLLFLVPIVLMGCSMVCNKHNQPDGSYTSSTAYIPAWPWQDSQRTIERMNVSAKTNGTFTASVRGLEEIQSTSTNLADIIRAVAEGVVSGVIKTK